MVIHSGTLRGVRCPICGAADCACLGEFPAGHPPSIRLEQHMAGPANVVVQTAQGLRFKLNQQQVDAWIAAHPGSSVVPSRYDTPPAPATTPEPATSTDEGTTPPAEGSSTTATRRTRGGGE